MKVFELAKVVGQESSAVAKAFGIESERGFAMKELDDAKAQEYIKSHGVVPPAAVITEAPRVEGRNVRFWSARRGHYLPTDGAQKRGDIRFRDWIFSTGADSEEAKYLRGADVCARTQIYEVFDKPYGEPEQIANFILFLRTLVYTGQTPQDGASREGRECVWSLLRAGEGGGLDKGDVEGVIRKVAKSKSLSLEV
jgi:hypothetical protein